MCLGDEDCDCHLDDGDEFDEEFIDDDDDEDPDFDSDLIDGVGFADPGGTSSLRAATENNPRNRPCSNCGVENRLTPIDEARGYVCDCCAEAAERGW